MSKEVEKRRYLYLSVPSVPSTHAGSILVALLYLKLYKTAYQMELSYAHLFPTRQTEIAIKLNIERQEDDVS